MQGITVYVRIDHPVSFSAQRAYKHFMVSLLYFGRFSDIAAGEEVSLPESVDTAQDVINWLSEKHDGFAREWERAGARMAVNKELVLSPAEQVISDSDEIAFMSALSGG